MTISLPEHQVPIGQRYQVKTLIGIKFYIRLSHDTTLLLNTNSLVGIGRWSKCWNGKPCRYVELI